MNSEFYGLPTASLQCELNHFKQTRSNNSFLLKYAKFPGNKPKTRTVYPMLTGALLGFAPEHR